MGMETAVTSPRLKLPRKRKMMAAARNRAWATELSMLSTT